MAWWLAESVVVTAALALVVAAICRTTRIGPVARHALWVIVLVKFVAPPVVAWPWALTEGRGQKAEGRQKAEERQKTEDRGQKAEGRQKAEDRRQKAEGGRRKAEGRRQKAEGKGNDLCLLPSYL